MVLEYKKQVVITIILIVFISILNISMYIVDKRADCNKCHIEFKNVAKYGVAFPPEIIKVRLIDLYNNFTNKECLVFWDRNNGYMYKGSLIDYEE